MNVSGADSNSSNSVDFWYDEGDGWVQIESSVDSSGSSGNYYWATEFSDGNLGSMNDLDLKANFSGVSSDYSTETTVSLDKGGPDSFSLDSPDAITNNEDPNVEVSVSDDFSGVKNVSFTVEDSDNNEEESNSCNSSSCSVDLDNLDDEEYDVSITAYDNVDNTESKTKSFTVDTSYDGDSTPSLDWESGEDDGIILMDEDETLTLGFDEDDDEEPDTVTCYRDYEDSDDKGDEIDEASDEGTDGGEYRFDCDFDEDDYSGEEVDLTIEFCDAAGNCDTYEPDNSPFVFDAEGPTVSELSTRVSAVNGDFEVDYTATDESGIAGLEYFFDEDTDVGDGNNVSQEDTEGSFMVDVSDLDSGENTVYVRAQDNAGRWSDSESLTFDYFPNSEPEVSMTVPSSMKVTAGQKKQFGVQLKNTGELIVEEVNVTASGNIISETETVDSLFPEESTNLTFEVDTGEDDIGSQTVNVDSDNPSASESFDVRVRANQEQKSSIESKLSEYQVKRDDLKERAESQKGGIRQNLYSEFESNFTEFESKIEAAQASIDSGAYYEAQSELENIESSYSNADSSFEQVREIDQKKDREQMILMGLVGLLVLGGAAGGFLWYSDDYGLNLERFADSDISVRGFDDLKARINTVLASEDEAEEFEWNGFK